jgi:hypothetical protein
MLLILKQVKQGFVEANRTGCASLGSNGTVVTGNDHNLVVELLTNWS